MIINDNDDLIIIKIKELKGILLRGKMVKYEKKIFLQDKIKITNKS